MTGQIEQFGAVLGLNPGFLRRVERFGQKAIIERVRAVDQTGAHGRFLSLVQQFGMWFDDEMAEQKPMDEGVMGEAIDQLAQLHGIDPQLAIRLMGAVLETFQLTLKRSALEGSTDDAISNDSVRGQPETTGRPGGNRTA